MAEVPEWASELVNERGMIPAERLAEMLRDRAEQQPGQPVERLAEPSPGGVTFQHLPGGWVAFAHPGFPGHRVSVLADTSDRLNPRLIGLRIEPHTDERGNVHPDTPTLDAKALRSLRVSALAKAAKDAWALNMQALPKSWAKVRGSKPYGGSAEHEEAVRAVYRDAQRRGETPARALMDAFDTTRATAYRWIKDYRLNEQPPAQPRTPATARSPVTLEGENVPKRKYRGRDWWQTTKMMLLDEQDGSCPWCGAALLSWEEVAVHHRRRRLGRDSDDDLVNLLLLHGQCHRFAHASPTLAKERGVIVPTWANPLDVPKPTGRMG